MHIEVHEVGCEVQADPGETLQQCPTAKIVDLVRRSGYVLIRGFKPTVEDFEVFTGRFGTCAGTRDVHYPESGAGLGFHAEDAYNPYRPDTLWFLCVYEGSNGGIPTGVVDGIELLDSLPERWQSFCRGTQIRFDRQFAADVWRNAQQVTSRADLETVLSRIPGIEYRFLADDSLYVGYQTPLVVRTADGRESFSNTLLQALADPEFYGMAMADGSPVPAELPTVLERLAVAHERHVGWSSGEVAVIDNLRMMHRRSAFRQVDRDLRARHCEDFFGSSLPETNTPLAAWAKSLIQGDVALPSCVGRPPEPRSGGSSETVRQERSAS